MLERYRVSLGQPRDHYERIKGQELHGGHRPETGQGVRDGVEESTG